MRWGLCECFVFRLFIERSISCGVVAGRPPNLLQSSAGAKGRSGRSRCGFWPATQGDKTHREWGPRTPPVFPPEAPIGFLVFKGERVLDAQQYVHSASLQAAQACLGWRSWGKDKHNHKHTTIDQQSEKVSNRAKLRFRRFETDQTSLRPLLSTHLNSTRTLASLPSIQKPTSFVPSSNSISLLTQFPFSFSFITSSFSTLLSSS